MLDISTTLDLGNARTHARAREARDALIAAVMAGEPVAAAARRLGLSRSTAYRLLGKSAARSSLILARVECQEALLRAAELKRSDPGLSAEAIRRILLKEGFSSAPSRETLRARLAKAALAADQARADELVRRAAALYRALGRRKRRNPSQNALIGSLLSEARALAPERFATRAAKAMGVSRMQVWRFLRSSQGALSSE